MKIEQLRELGSRLDSIFRPLGEELVDRVGEPSGNLGIDLSERAMAHLGDLSQDRQRRIALEGRTTAAHFIENRAQTEKIGTRVGRFAHRLFGRHIERSAAHETGASELHIFGGAGQAEVGQLHAVVRRLEQNVARLDIAVNQPLGMRGREAMRGLHADAHDLAHRQRLFAVEPLLERFAGNELHHQIR